jgi:Mn-containing catalase
MAGIWGKAMALPRDPPGEFGVVDGMPDGAKSPELEGTPSAFAPDYVEEMYEIASKLYKK